MNIDAERWNRRYREHVGPRRDDVAPELERHAPLLGVPGRGLEIACGTAANALWLAARGWRMIGMDVSVEGARIARQEALRRGASLELVVGDAAAPPIAAAARFDLIVVVRFLDRALFPWIERSLAPGGRLFYATFNRGRLLHHPGFNADFVLERGELAGAFAALEPLAGDDAGSISWLLARRR